MYQFWKNRTTLAACLMGLLSIDVLYGTDEAPNKEHTYTPQVTSAAATLWRSSICQRFELPPEAEHWPFWQQQCLQHTAAAHKTVSTHALTCVKGTWEDLNHTTKTEKAYLGLFGCCSLYWGTFFMPDFFCSLTYLTCITGGCAATEETTRQANAARLVQLVPPLAGRMGLPAKETDGAKKDQ